MTPAAPGKAPPLRQPPALGHKAQPRRHRQRAGFVRAVLHGVLHGHGVLAVRHRHTARHPHAQRVVHPARRGGVKQRQAPPAVLALGAGPVLGGKEHALFPHRQRLAQTVYQVQPFGRGRCAGHQQRVVAARGRPRRRQRAVPAQAVGQQKAVLLRAGQHRQNRGVPTGRT